MFVFTESDRANLEEAPTQDTKRSCCWWKEELSEWAVREHNHTGSVPELQLNKWKWLTMIRQTEMCLRTCSIRSPESSKLPCICKKFNQYVFLEAGCYWIEYEYIFFQVELSKTFRPLGTQDNTLCDGNNTCDHYNQFSLSCSTVQLCNICKIQIPLYHFRQTDWRQDNIAPHFVWTICLAPVIVFCFITQYWYGICLTHHCGLYRDKCLIKVHSWNFGARKTVYVYFKVIQVEITINSTEITVITL